MKRKDSTDPPAHVTCASCGKPVAPEEALACAICRRPVCRACVRPYGHHMLACDDCRLAEW